MRWDLFLSHAGHRLHKQCLKYVRTREAARSISAHLSLCIPWPNRNPRNQLTGGEARCDAELLLELLPDPELGYEGTGTGGAARGKWVNMHTSGSHYSSGDVATFDWPSTSALTTETSSQHQATPLCIGTSSAPKSMTRVIGRYTQP